MRNIIITGASKGIGFDTALALAADAENKIIAISRDSFRLSQLIEIGKKRYQRQNIQAITLDLTDVKHPAWEQLKVLQKVDVLINNAGVLINKPFRELTNTDWQLLFQTNVFAAAELIRFLLPQLEASTNAHIINIGSMGGFQGSSKFSGLSAYSASKAALANLTECLAEEFKDKNIAVNCLALGAVQTEMLANAFPGYEAPITSQKIAQFIANFSVNGHQFQNGKILPISISTP